MGGMVDCGGWIATRKKGKVWWLDSHIEKMIEM